MKEYLYDHSKRNHSHLISAKLRFPATRKRMMSSSSSRTSTKTLMDYFLQPAKRLKTSPSSPSSPSSPILAASTNSSTSPTHPPLSSSLTAPQKSRIHLNKLLAKSKRNLTICSDRLSNNNKGEGGERGGGWAAYINNNVKLEELLVEETWLEALPVGEFQKPYVLSLSKFLETEISISSSNNNLHIYPPPQLIFNSLNSTPFDSLKAVIIGQDPYHGTGQAMGLAFSVPEGIKVPSSLLNIFKELGQDLGCSIPNHGNLQRWAVQGVLLLNTVLTVRSHQANSHAKKGWEQFTDAVIRTISQKKEGVVFLLWGNSAQEKSRLIDVTKHHILKAAHPSGLSANRGFFGCRHFSRTNQLLEQMGIIPIDWQL